MGKRIAFLGDDTWLSLFPQTYFTSRFVEAHPSFNAWDLDTVDRAVNKTLHHPDLFRAGVSDWDVLITHLLGVDHCGHRYEGQHLFLHTSDYSTFNRNNDSYRCF